MKTRVGVIDGGLHAQEAFSFDADVKYLYLGTFRWHNIWSCDVIVVPIHTDQIFLSRHKALLTRYAKAGGVLVLLGATTYGRPWVPLYRIEAKFTQSLRYYAGTRDGQAVFRNILDEEALRFHNSYFGHGNIGGGDESDTLLADDKDGRPVMLVRRIDSGTIFITTLDPDYHSVTHVPGPASEKVEDSHRKAHRLLRNIFNWAKVEAEGKGLRNQWYRRLRWIGGGVWFWVPHAVLYFLPVLSVGLYILWKKPGSSLAVPGASFLFVASVLGLTASVITVVSFLVTRRALKEQ